MAASDVKKELQKLASSQKAKASAWFFKTGKGQYGEGDQFIGVTVPEQRKVAKQFRDLPLVELAKLLTSPIHEHRLTALFILVWQYQHAHEISPNPSLQKRGTPPFRKGRLGGISGPREIVDFYLAHRKHVNNWDLVDSSASYILGDYLLTHPNDGVILSVHQTRIEGSGRILHTLATSKSLWDRRIAIIATGAFIQHSQFDDTLHLAELLLADKEDLMHKATGWMLREVGKRDESVLRVFLDKHAAHMPRTMLRYAIEKLPPADRKHYMQLRAS